MSKGFVMKNSVVMENAIVRTPVSLNFILEKLADGETVEQILDAHQQLLSRETIQEALAFAAEAVRTDVAYSIVAGTGITVELILGKLAGGETIEQVLESHPRLTRDAVYESLAFAAEDLRANMIYPLGEEVV